MKADKLPTINYVTTAVIGGSLQVIENNEKVPILVTEHWPRS